MPDAQHAVEVLREKIESGERGGSERDREALLEFSDALQLKRESYGWHRHDFLLRCCCKLSEGPDVDLVDALEDREVAEEIVRWIHKEYDIDDCAPETNQNYRVALRVFGKHMTDEGARRPDDPPESIDWVSTSLPSDYDPSPDPTEMLTWEEDIERLLDGARNPRDKAAIALQFDAGLRGGELYDLRVGDLTDSEHGLSVSVDGKTGQRSVELIPSTPYVNRWLTEHPSGDPDDYLWTHLNKPKRLSYTVFADMFTNPAERVGLEKSVTPTILRKSNLAWLAKQGMNARYIERRQGRQHGSDAVARYVAIFDEDVGDEYARIMGLEVAGDDDQEDLAPLCCPRCDRETPRDEDHCVWCGQAMSPEASEQASAQTADILDELAGLDGEQAEALAEVGQLLEEHPWLRSLGE